MTPITLDQIRSLAPSARNSYMEAFAHADEYLAPFGITDSSLRLAHFMAQVLHESGALTITEECLNYTHAERLMAVWPTRFPDVATAAPYVRNPQALANLVYGGRMGNSGPYDGWIYRGRGLLQITGRASYVRTGLKLGISLAANPDLAADPEQCLQVAAAEWQALNCNDAADQDDVKLVTARVNGGYIGLAERRAWLVKTKAVWVSD